MNWSKFQLDIFDYVENSDKNIIISAIAGSGKTTCLVEASNRFCKKFPTSSAIFLAFNKSIAEELKRRVNPKLDVMTMHSLGYKAILSKFGKEVKINNYKVNDLIKIASSNWQIDLPKNEHYDYQKRIKKLVDLGRLSNSNSYYKLHQLALEYEIQNVADEIEHAIEVIHLCKNQRDTIDFTDMLYFPIAHNLPMPKYDMIFIDEAQDLSVVQHEMLKKIITKNGRYIIIGDEFQSIYSFAGADSQSFNKLRQIDNLVELPLQYCYRCGSNIVLKAQQYNPHILPAPNAVPGIVRNGSVFDAKNGDWVLCRYLKPLVTLCLKFIARNIKAKINGKDIADNIVSMIRQTKKTTIIELHGALYKKLTSLKSEIVALGINDPENTEIYQNMIDKIEVIKTLSFGCNSVEELVVKIDDLFSNDNEGVILSTIHKAKGKEAERVYIICFDLMPSKYAKTKDQVQQEVNLQYIAITRAKNELIFDNNFSY